MTRMEHEPVHKIAHLHLCQATTHMQRHNVIEHMNTLQFTDHNLHVWSLCCLNYFDVRLLTDL